MKKGLISLILVLLLITSSAMAEDYSTMSTEELYSIQNSIRNELLKRDLDLNGKTLLFEKNGVSLYLTGDYEMSRSGEFRLNVIVINDSDHEISVTPNNLKASVNGWDVSCTSSTNVSAGKKLKGYYDFTVKDADVATLDQIEEIELRLYIYDNNIWERICTIDPIVIQFPIK